jgi:hypothetical protein
MALHALELPARKVVGNPSDAAILSFCHAFVNVDDLKELKEQVGHPLRSSYSHVTPQVKSQMFRSQS